MDFDIDALREPLLAARLLREDILAWPVRPDTVESTRRGMASLLAPPGASRDALGVAAALGTSDDLLDIRSDMLAEIASAAGGGALRTGPGASFHGRPAPPPAEVPGLLDELLGEVSSPAAVEGWSPVVRAFALHFLLRVVQPFEAPAAAVGHAAEAMVLASDGFDARLLPIGDPAAVGAPRDGRPDPGGFALARAHALVEALGEAREQLRDATARALLHAWAESPRSGWNARRRRFLVWAETARGGVRFRDYVRLAAGASSPSLRTLQRDWARLRDEGWLVPGPSAGALVLSTAPLHWEQAAAVVT